MAAGLKLIKFSFGEQEIKYKFPCNASTDAIDSYLRRAFHFSNDIQYFLIDNKDGSHIDISSLCYLVDGSNISIKVENINKSSRDERTSDV
jgi:hypothetical protein